MSALVPIDQAAKQISPLMAQRMAAQKATNNNFSDGIRDAFPMLSIKGKVFRVRKDGAENLFLDPNTRQPLQFLDIVLVNASPAISKSYYTKGFTDGDLEAPNCWSLDGVKPDPSVAEKVNPICATCPMNAFGSRTTEGGKAAKACSDARRIAVVMPSMLASTEQLLMLLRVPQSSLKNLKTYVQLLQRNNVEPNGCVTRMMFDFNEAFPKIIFEFVQLLPETSYVKAIELAEADNTKLMLQTPDFEGVATTTAHQEAIVSSSVGTMQGAALQAAPLLEGMFTGQPVHQQAEQPAQQVQQVSMADAQPADAWPPAGVITLPDGKFFDTATKMFVTKPEPKPEPVKQAEPEVALIELPDGRFFNPATGQYVEKVVAKPRELDPATMKLPDGQFFNPTMGGYVVGPYLGDGLVVTKVEPEIQAPEKPKRTRKTKETPVAQTIEHQAAAPEDDGDDEGDVAPVQPAPSGLEAMLAALVPPSA